MLSAHFASAASPLSRSIIIRMRSLLLSLAALRTTSAAVSAVHLGLSSDPTRLFVQWTYTAAGAAQSATYGETPSNLNMTAAGSSWSWSDSNTGRTYHHAIATMTGLMPGAVFYYRVGGGGDASPVLRAQATRAAAQFSTAAPLVIGWLGDLGVANAQALPYLVNETGLDLFIHVSWEAPEAGTAPADHRRRASYPPSPSPFSHSTNRSAITHTTFRMPTASLAILLRP